VHLALGFDDCAAVLDLTKKTGLGGMQPHIACTTLLRTATGGLITKAAFDHCMQVCVYNCSHACRHCNVYYTTDQISTFTQVRVFDSDKCLT
jgi:hypothetical protein